MELWVRQESGEGVPELKLKPATTKFKSSPGAWRQPHIYENCRNIINTQSTPKTETLNIVKVTPDTTKRNERNCTPPPPYDPYCLVNPESCKNAFDTNEPERPNKSDAKPRLAAKSRESAGRYHETYVSLALVVTVCFNCPIGLIAVLTSVSAMKSFERNDLKSGKLKAKMSVVISMIAIVATLAIMTGVVMYVAGQKKGSSRP